MACTLLTGFTVFTEPPPPTPSRYPMFIYLSGQQGQRDGRVQRRPRLLSRPSGLQPACSRPGTAQRTHSWTLFPPEFTLHSFSGIHFLLHILALSFFHSQENWSFYSISPFPSFHSFPLKKCAYGFVRFFFPCEI